MAEAKLNNQSRKYLIKALCLSFVITLLTGLWEYQLKFDFKYLGGVSNQLRGLPLPYGVKDLNGNFSIEIFFLMVDLVFWLIISILLVGRLLKRV